MHRSFNVPRGFVAPLLSVLALSLFIAPQTTHAQWAQWGGPNRDFVIDSKGLAAKWPEDGPKKLWTRELGEGYSAIVAEGDRLYTMYRGGDQERIVALNAKNGETIWETPYDAKPHEEHVSQFGDGPRSTPLIDGDKMYTIGVSGVMHCVNKADGKVNWKKDLWKEMSGTFLNHGYSSSPMAYKDTIIVLVGGEDHAIVAFNKSDGSVKWQKQSFGNSYSSPRLYKVDGSEQLITFMGTEVVGLNPDNGDLLWSFPHENQWKQNVCMPVMGPDNILVISAPEAGTKGLKLTRTGSDWKAEPAWESRKVQFYHTTAIPVDNCVYGSTGGATGGPAFFAAIDMKTGKVLWRERGLAKATALYADGHFIILDEDGVLALAKATPEKFEVISKSTVLDKVAWTVPTLSGKTLFLRDKKTIVALDLGGSDGT